MFFTITNRIKLFFTILLLDVWEDLYSLCNLTKVEFAFALMHVRVQLHIIIILYNMCNTSVWPFLCSKTIQQFSLSGYYKVHQRYLSHLTCMSNKIVKQR